MAIIERPSSVGRQRWSLWRAMLWPRREATPRRTARVPWIPIVIISVIVIMAVFAPLLALAAMMPALVWRILDEEEFLAAGLPGYEAYRQKVRYRLIPGVW